MKLKAIVVFGMMLLIVLARAGTPPPISITGLQPGNASGAIVVASGAVTSVSPGTSGNVLTSNGVFWYSSPSAGGGVWGSITGTLSNQTDLQSALNAKEPTISPGNSLQYWRGDKTFQTLNTLAVPELTNLYFTQARARESLSVSLPLSYSSSTGAFTIAQSGASSDGYLSSVDWLTFNSKQSAGNYITALTGDMTASGPGSVAASLATVNPTVGTFGSSSSVGQFTVNGKGLVTIASSASIQIAESQVTNLVSDLAGKQDLITPGTASQYYRGDKTFQDLETNVVSESATALYYTDARARASISATSPMTYSSSTGVIATPNFVSGTAAAGTAGLVPAPSINQGLTDKYLSASGAFGYPGIKTDPETASRAVSVWTTRSVTANQWFGAAWAPELHLFCAISSSGTNRVMWSRDGASWTAASAIAAVVWTKVAWSPELRLFAAVAFDGTTTTNLMTSPDCRTWTSRTSPEANQWYDITWASGLNKFVAVSITGTNRCMSSTDGLSWSACSMAAAIQWYAVTWSPELKLFVAVSITASGGNYAATSPDGITWTMQALSTGNTWYSVTWSPELNLFVTVGATGTSRAATSPDGINWTLRGIQAQAWRRVKWSPQFRLFVAVSSGGTISTSPDGINWTARTSPEANQWYELVYSPELMRFAIFGITGTNRVLTSKDIGYLISDKLVNDATPSNITESVVRRDQNGSAAFGVVFGSAAVLTGTVNTGSAALLISNGHMAFTQAASASATVLPAAGSGATCSLTNGADSIGTISLTTGTALFASGAQCNINFSGAFSFAPKCQLQPINTNAAAASLSMFKTASASAMTVNFATPEVVSSTNYQWDYFCAQPPQ